jgi:hypothetical protein
MRPSALLAEGLILKVPTQNDSSVVRDGRTTTQAGQECKGSGISAKAADRHVQNAYAKIGVSTGTAAARFAMEHRFVAWGEPPMDGATGCS